MGTDLEIIDALHPGLGRLMIEKGWRQLTPIQRSAIPIVLRGSDCVIEAPTAGGKTEAMLFPALSRASRSSATGVKVLYLAPLRALLNNLEERAQVYAAACGMHAFKWHGDVSQRTKLAQLRVPPDLLLTTPESLEAILLRTAEWKEFLGGLQIIVIDEAHNFALGDRGHHLLSVLERLGSVSEQPAQRVAATATIGNPDHMLRWLAGRERAPGQRVQVHGDTPTRDYEVRIFDKDADTPETPPHQLATVRRFHCLYETLRGRRSIVFAGSRTKAEDIARSFAHLNIQDVSIRTHHSAVSKFFREEAEALLQRTQEEGINAIVSTSTLELGIDIGELDQVIQLDALGSPAALLQRVGRTGRRPGRPQVLRGLCLNRNDLPLLTATVQLALEGRSEALSFPRRAFHILAHQILCMALQHHGVTEAQVWDTLARAWSFSGVHRHELTLLVDHMVREDYLRRDGELLLTGDLTEKRFLGAGWRRLFAVFNTAPLYEVRHGQEQVGTLDASFVETLTPPFNFVLAGRQWTATSVDPKARVVRAKRARLAGIPKWSSFGGLDVPLETAQAVGRLLLGDVVPSFLHADAAEVLRDQRLTVRGSWEPGAVVVHASAARLRIVTYAGDRINRTLAKLMEAEDLGQPTASYASVELRNTSAGAAAAVMAILQRWRETGAEADLERRVGPLLPTFPFSPFAQCLPPPLYQAALTEMALDVRGLLGLLGSSHLMSRALT